MRLPGIAAALTLSTIACLANAAYMGPFDGAFEPIARPRCYEADTYDGFRVGGQYLDPGNGVIYGMHSMLVRWQEPDAFAGVAVECTDFAMTIDTRRIAHRPIEGGGYNDMYGYAWPPGSRPRPFVKDGLPTHLVLQANVAVSSWLPTKPDGSSNASDTSADSCLFAYLRDKHEGHESLHPIAILACTHHAGVPLVHAQAPATAAFDYIEGVWFGAGIISNDPANNRAFVSTYYTAASTRGLSPFGPVADPDIPFFRAHIRPEDWIELVEAIEADECPFGCPARGYSTDPADYELEYAGLLVEAAIRNDRYDVSATEWIANDPAKPQVKFSVHGRGLGIYRALPGGMQR